MAMTMTMTDPEEPFCVVDGDLLQLGGIFEDLGEQNDVLLLGEPEARGEFEFVEKAGSAGEVVKDEEAEGLDVEASTEYDGVIEEERDACPVENGTCGHEGEEGVAVEKVHDEDEHVPVQSHVWQAKCARKSRGFMVVSFWKGYDG